MSHKSSTTFCGKKWTRDEHKIFCRTLQNIAATLRNFSRSIALSVTHASQLSHSHSHKTFCWPQKSYVKKDLSHTLWCFLTHLRRNELVLDFVQGRNHTLFSWSHHVFANTAVRRKDLRSVMVVSDTLTATAHVCYSHCDGHQIPCCDRIVELFLALLSSQEEDVDTVKQGSNLHLKPLYWLLLALFSHKRGSVVTGSGLNKTHFSKCSQFLFHVLDQSQKLILHVPVSSWQSWRVPQTVWSFISHPSAQNWEDWVLLGSFSDLVQSVLGNPQMVHTQVKDVACLHLFFAATTVFPAATQENSHKSFCGSFFWNGWFLRSLSLSVQTNRYKSGWKEDQPKTLLGTQETIRSECARYLQGSWTFLWEALVARILQRGR